MNIVVLAKQVPDTTEIMVDKVTGTLIRDGVASIINPDDLAGLEEALKIKDKLGATVTVVSMGPPQATGMLAECFARGADRCVLLTDRAFAGSDTWATSNALAAALKLIGFDFVIAGRQAIDGDTAQVGPQTAEKLGIPQITYVEEIIDISEKSITVKKAWEDSSEILEAKMPCLITTLATMNKPRYMNCADIWTAYDKQVEILTFDMLGISADRVGLKASPTNVFKSFNKELSAKIETLTLEPKEAAEKVIGVLTEKQLLS